MSASPTYRGDRTPVAPGTSSLRQLGGGDALFHVPTGLGNGPAPLVVMLHGAGGTPRHSVDLAATHADRLGFALLAPKSAVGTWDVIARRRYGADVAAIDDLLNRVFEALPIDPAHVAVAGFSDGASYALSLGLSNGGLFSHVLAFSPGFMAPSRLQGAPRVLISPGDGDAVLPIEPCSRRIVAQLRAMGREPDYREFRGGHEVPAGIARWAFTAATGADARAFEASDPGARP